MSDTTDGRETDVDASRRERIAPLRERMEQFLTVHDPDEDLASARAARGGGKPLSEIVEEDRDGRL